MEAADPSLNWDRSSLGRLPHSMDWSRSSTVIPLSKTGCGSQAGTIPPLAITIASLHSEYRILGLLHRWSEFYRKYSGQEQKKKKTAAPSPMQLNVPQQSVPHSAHLGLQPVFLLFSSCSLAGGVEGSCVEISTL